MDVRTQIAGKMLSAQVVEEPLLIEEVFFAEIAPGVGKNFSLLFVARVSVLDMGPELLQMV